MEPKGRQRVSQAAALACTWQSGQMVRGCTADRPQPGRCRKVCVGWEDGPRGNQVPLRAKVDKHLESLIASKKASGTFPVGARTISGLLDPS